MKHGVVTCLAIGILLAASADAQEPRQASARFVNTEDEQIGTATLTQTPHGVLIQVDVSQLPPGEHAIHIHETGACDSAGGFDSAGGHYAPRAHQHGYAAEDGHHAGDMPNQFVGEDGVLRAHLFNADVTLDDGEATLLDDNGSALVIHATADDYKSQPSGNAGSRIACAVIEES